MRGTLLALALLTACGSSGPRPPPIQDGEQTERFTEYTVPGLTLWRVHGAVPDHEWSSVVGVDAAGNVISGARLFQRATSPAMAPAMLAPRAIQLLGIGGSLLATGTDAGQFGTAEEKALVAPSSVAAGVLTMWLLVGEMSPRITRVTVRLVTGDVQQIGAAELVAHGAPR